MLSTDLLERQLLDALPSSVYALDLDGRVIGGSRTAVRTGDDTATTHPSSGADGKGKPVWEVIDEGLSRAQVEHAIRLLRAGRASVVRWELARATSGQHAVVLAQMTPLRDESHAVTGFVVCTTDITSSARAREAVSSAGLALARTTDLDRVWMEAAHQLREILRPDAVVIATVDDNAATPRVVYDTGSDADRRALETRFTGAWRSALDSGNLVTSTVDSTVEVTTPIIGTAGPLGVITITTEAVDSPERFAESLRFLEAVAAHTATAIERAQQIARSGRRKRSEAIGEVAAGVAQELRNPIFGISSAAQLLRFRAREDPVMERNVGRILREVERLNRMVTTLVELGRPIALKLSPGDPDSVWDDVLESERGRLESRAVAVRRIRPDTPTSIPIDGELLAQAFRGILSNAVEAAPEASDITLASVTLPNGSWRCRLTNGGDPITPELLPRVFEPFFSTKPGSTGVGLALAQRVVEAHHGAIGIESTAEAGTTASVTLPNTSRTATLP